MAGTPVEKLSHKCGTHDALQVFMGEDGEYNGFCYACRTYVSDPYKDRPVGYKPKIKVKTHEEVDDELEEINECESLGLPDRKLPIKAVKQFNIKVGMSEVDGKTPALHFYPYTLDGKFVRYKARAVKSKAMWSVGHNDLPKDVDLFGWEQAVRTGSKRLYITEGELDAAAVFTIIMRNQRKEYSDNIPAVVSLPNGAGCAKRDISRLLPKITRNFKEVVLVFDDDDAGRKATEDVMGILPNAKSANLPCKDANDCLIEGVSKAAFNALMFNASKPKNTRLVWGRDVHEEAKKPAEYGLSFPWQGLNDITRGLRFGETYYIAAGEKLGKSEVVNAFTAHFIEEHNLKVMVAKPEEANNKTYKMVVSKVVGKIFHDPKVEFDESAYERGGKIVRDNLCMLNLYQHVGWDTLKADIIAAAAEGIKVVIIDPITNLTNGMSNSDIDSHLKGVAQEAAAMAMDLDIAIMFFCHLNKPPKGSTPWDRGGKITTDYFAGSSAMARSCNYAMGLQGNKDPDLSEEERNMRELVILADREFGESGSVNLYWDKHTALFNEIS